MTLKYKGYVGIPEVDAEAGVIRGRVANTRDMITFQGQTVAETEQAFRDSVDDYLAFCAERGEEPEKPFSGKFLVRVSPSVHQALFLEAERAGMSLNELVKQFLAQGIKQIAKGADRTSSVSSRAPKQRTKRLSGKPG